MATGPFSGRGPKIGLKDSSIGGSVVELLL